MSNHQKSQHLDATPPRMFAGQSPESIKLPSFPAGAGISTQQGRFSQFLPVGNDALVTGRMNSEGSKFRMELIAAAYVKRKERNKDTPKQKGAFVPDPNDEPTPLVDTDDLKDFCDCLSKSEDFYQHMRNNFRTLRNQTDPLLNINELEHVPEEAAEVLLPPVADNVRSQRKPKTSNHPWAVMPTAAEKERTRSAAGKAFYDVFEQLTEEKDVDSDDTIQ